ncbi:hypothetical protein AGMMS49938_18690 [Fibrobacterales bacterium]|nr:hypothetical protein AGMMS49938_18690 [Fibrobacterales bacterium]
MGSFIERYETRLLFTYRRKQYLIAYDDGEFILIFQTEDKNATNGVVCKNEKKARQIISPKCKMTAGLNDNIDKRFKNEILTVYEFLGGKNPKRDIKTGIMGRHAIVTLFNEIICYCADPF